MSAENHKQLFTKIAEVQRVVGPVKKNQDNPYLSNQQERRIKYADLEAVTSAINGAMEDAGLCFIALPDGDAMCYMLACIESGDFIEGRWPLPGPDNQQRVAAATTYGRRYTLCCLFNIITEDDDGETAMGRGRVRAGETSASDVARGIAEINKLAEKRGISQDDVFAAMQAVNPNVAAQADMTVEELREIYRLLERKMEEEKT